MNGLKTPKTSIIILAGGQGTRLRSLDPSRPKPMVVVHGKPFLYWLIQHYKKLGFQNFVLSTGYLAHVIEEYSWNKDFPELEITFSREDQPLGTGGALLQVFDGRPELQSAWVINGDTLLPHPLPNVAGDAEAFYVALHSEKIFDAKPNLVTENGRVVKLENNSSANAFDGGAVFVTRKALQRYHEVGGKVPCMLHEVLKPAMDAQKVRFAFVPVTCFDIGTPERFRRFEEYLKENV